MRPRAVKERGGVVKVARGVYNHRAEPRGPHQAKGAAWLHERLWLRRMLMGANRPLNLSLIHI